MKITAKKEKCPFNLPLCVGLSGNILKPHKNNYTLIDNHFKLIAQNLTEENAYYIQAALGQ